MLKGQKSNYKRVKNQENTVLKTKTKTQKRQQFFSNTEFYHFKILSSCQKHLFFPFIVFYDNYHIHYLREVN